MNQSFEQNKNLLIFESGLQLSRQYWLKDFVELGYNLFLAQPWTMSWEKPYIKNYLQINLNPWTNLEINKILNFITKNKIDCLICLNEGTVPFASEIIKILGLPNLSKEDIKNLRNKYSMRTTLLESGILQPKFHFIDEDTSIDSLKVNYPVVVKPTELMASLGVKLVKNKEELLDAVNSARNVDFDGENLRLHYGFKKNVLIESYLSGDEFSVETFIQNGEIIDFFVTKKYKCPEPYFDEIAHLANPQLSDSLNSQIRDFVFSIHKKLGILNSITHTEIKINGDQIGLIEIGCRPGGDLIPLLHNLSASFKFAEVMANIHMGIKVQNNWKPLNSRKQVAVFFPHDRNDFIASKSILDEILSDSKIFEYVFNETNEKINVGLATSRKGQIVFSHENKTNEILQNLVKYSGGI